MDSKETPKIKIPISDIYKVHLLDSSGIVKRIYVFCKNTMNEENINELFSESEKLQIESNKTEIVFTNSQIHKDDSIRIIKKKLIHEIGENNVCYDEMYLFVNVLETLNIMTLYDLLTNNEKKLLTRQMIVQLCFNMNMDENKMNELLENIGMKENYTYNDLNKIIQYDTLYSFSIPFGQKFLDERDYLFSSNPFLLSEDSIGFIDFTKKSLLSFENQLVLNYGNIENQNIYLTLVEDVLEFTEKSNLDSEYMIQCYYPLLYREAITTIDDFNREKQRLIKQNNEILDKNTLFFYKTIDIFYDIYNGRGNNELKYEERGIKYFQIKIKSEFKNILPLEVIFKNIHSTKQIPFIKYNPGNRRENIYRLYTEQKTRDGKYIPFLSEGVILKLSKQLGKNKQVSLYIQYIENEKEGPIYFYIDIENNGDILIHADLKKALVTEDLTKLLQKAVNPIIENINTFLEQTGYKIRTIQSLKQSYIEVIDIKYITEFILEKELKLNKFIGCISSVFDIIKDDEQSGTLMRFKRVENFQEMDAQTLLITETFKTTNNMNDVINILMKNYKMTEDAANLRIIQYLSEHKDIRGKIIDNPGFPVLFKISKLDKKLLIEVNNVISIDYLNILYLYFDSILRITQQPHTTIISKDEIISICTKANKITKQADKSHIDNVISTTIIEPIKQITQKIQPIRLQEEDEDEDDENAIFFEDEENEDYDAVGEEIIEKKSPEENSNSEEGIFFEDEEEENDESESEQQFTSDERYKTPSKIIGGKPYIYDDDDDDEKEFIANPVGKSLKYPNLFYSKMKQYDPVLFSTEEDGDYKGYSTICQSSRGIQPVLLTKSEFDKINIENPGSYNDYIKYGTDPDKPYYYICPRYWCLLTNTSMTEEDVKAGKCAKMGVPDKIIPKNAKVVPKDAFVYEFNNPVEHLDEKGEYIMHYPGFKKGKHPKGYGLPCCFKKPKQNWEYNQEEQPPKKGRPPGRRDAPQDKNISYIISNETFPIRQLQRFGFLPISIQKFLQTNSNKYTTKDNSALIKPNTDCILRYSVEQLPNQSILGSLAELYAYTQQLDKTPSVVELKEIMTQAITIDKFIHYNNSTLVSVFKPKKINIDSIDISKYENSEFYKNINIDNEYQYDFLEDTIASYENFLKYILSNDSIIDHKYMWDIFTDDNSNLIKGGINLVILEIVDNDITNNVKVLCPTNSQRTKLYDTRKETFILIKYGDYYEPIYVYNQSDGQINVKKVFTEKIKNTEEESILGNIKKILIIIQKATKKYCPAQPSLPRIYNFKKNIYLNELYIELKTLDYKFRIQVMNYQGNIIGLVVENANNNHVFVPCFPSTTIKELNDIPIKFMDEDNNDIWNDYQTTVDELNTIYKNSDKKIRCLPKLKIIEDELIVGIITETNQFVQINPPSENIIQDELPEIQSSNYIIADKIITTSRSGDKERETMIRKISLESNFYSLFRSTIRNLLNQYENSESLKKIIEIYENNTMLYKEKLTNIIDIIKDLTKNKIEFAYIQDDILKEYNNILCSLTKCNETEYCIRKEDGSCKLVIPKKHLISNVDNENVYYGRIADELLRYSRIRLFMTQPKSFLNITNVDYKLNENEFIIIQSSINNDYLKNLVAFNVSDNVFNVTHETALPQITQMYSNEVIPLTEQYETDLIDDKKLNETVMECIKETVDVIGQPNESLWKRIFPKKSKEIIFKNTNNNCSFYPLIYIFQNKYREQISILSVKISILNGYKEYMKKYENKILSILKKQGKKNIVSNIEKNIYTLETIIMSEDYYLTDLDIWIFAQTAKIQICLFSRNGLKGINENIEWKMLNQLYRENHYFIRSPTTIINNKPSSYNVITPSYGLGELREFETIVQNAISGRTKEYDKNIELLNYYLEHL